MRLVKTLVWLVVCFNGSRVARATTDCDVDVDARLVCVDADATCIADGIVRVCAENSGTAACELDLLGVSCLVGVTCRDGGHLVECHAAVDACVIDAEARLLCATGSTTCTFDANVFSCSEDGGFVTQIDIGVGDTPGGAGGTPTDGTGSGGGSGGGGGGSDGGGAGTGGGDGSGGDGGGGDGGGGGMDPGTGDTTGTMDELGDSLYAVGGGCSTGSPSSSLALALSLGVLAVFSRRRRWATVGALALSANAHADTLNADSLRARMIGAGGVAVSDTTVLAPWSVGTTALASYASNPLQLQNSQGERTSAVVDGLTTLDLRAGIGLPGNVEVTMMVPLVLDRTGMEGLSARGTGDLDVTAKWSARRGRFGIGVMPTVVAPTGSAEFNSDGTWIASAAALGDVRIEGTTIAAMAGPRIRFDDTTFMNAATGNQVTWGALIDQTVTRRYDLHVLAEIHGAVAIGDASRADPAELLGGARARFGDWMAIAGAGVGLDRSVGVPTWRAFAGAAFTFGMRSSPRVQLATAPPPVAPPPVEPAVVDVEPAPVPQPAPPSDRDGDSIVDTDDRCPDAPETVNEFEDTDGCPDERPSYVFVAEKPLVFHDIKFATNKYRILPVSYPILDDIADSLRAQPAAKIRIEGHTDSRGGDRYNLVLSQQRALAVMNYLIGAGIDPARLAYEGYGPSRPIVPNDSAPHWAENRRVEIRTLSVVEAKVP